MILLESLRLKLTARYVLLLEDSFKSQDTMVVESAFLGFGLSKLASLPQLLSLNALVSAFVSLRLAFLT
jgi:hypothetical protein